MSEREARVLRKERARSLKATGIMITLLCGLCTATCAGPSAWSVASGNDPDYLTVFALQMAAVVGLLPMLVGVILYLVGRRMERSNR